MTHYIDKDALVAEINKLKGKVSDSSSYCNGWQHALRMLELSLDTLEVKEVDMEEKAIQLSQKYFPNEENIWARSNIEAQRCKSACIEMVEWLKAQKGEKV